MTTDQAITYYSRLASYHTQLAGIYQAIAANPEKEGSYVLPIRLVNANIQSATTNMVLALEVGKAAKQTQETAAQFEEIDKRLEKLSSEVKLFPPAEHVAPQESAG